MKQLLLTKMALVGMALLGGAAQATTITFTGPDDTSGNLCTPGASRCIIGSTGLYTIFSASLTQPTSPTSDWVLDIETDYPATIPNDATSIPTATWSADGKQYSIPDFLITWNNHDYAVVLSPHVKAGVSVDSYTSPGLYQGSGFQTSSQVIPPTSAVRPDEPVWLDTNGTPLSTGPASELITTNSGNDGTDGPLYDIKVDFTAPSDFLSTGNFDIQMSSFVCANGLLIGEGNFGTQATPEPSSFLFVAPLLLLAGYRLARRGALGRL